MTRRIDNNQQTMQMRLTRSHEKVVERKGGHIQPVCGATTYKSSGKRFETLSVVSVIKIT